jgi:hypothetical protein
MAILYQGLRGRVSGDGSPGSLFEGRVSLLYGRVRIKLPLFRGQGTGPALASNLRCLGKMPSVFHYFEDLKSGPSSQLERRSERRS